ncbi:MAG: L-rhamnose isomerase [Spirochaetaceae bacterium]|nr:MAG: L-rhamnose isomerase [Spirochaetaceae bacterium]
MKLDMEYAIWEERQKDLGIDVADVKKKLKTLKVETPSWGYADSGTRFKVFTQKGMPRTIFEKLDDAAQVHKYTGICPSVAVHIPWDKTDDWDKVAKHAAAKGLSIGAVNPNLFQEDEYKFGSVCNVSKEVRAKAIAHMAECIDIMKTTGSRLLSLWFADGTNYPGQADLRSRKRWMEEALAAAYKLLPQNSRMLIEYKFFEPAFYHTDIADWGMAYTFAEKLGDKACVLIDLGHHALGTNIEQIVAFLLDEGKMGGFHFNNKKFADDDLIVGSINPYELFLIFHEIIGALMDAKTSSAAEKIAYMIDQSHCIEPKVPAMIRSVLNVQTNFAKALLVNRKKLARAQQANDVLAAENEVRSAFETDVRPFLAVLREEMGLDPDPMAAYLACGYEEEKVKKRI